MIMNIKSLNTYSKFFLVTKYKNKIYSVKSLKRNNFCDTANTINLSEDAKLEKLKNDLKKLSLTYVNKYGWTENTLKIAANELGYSHMVSGVFPNGPLDLIYSLMDSWNEKLKKEIEKLKKDNTLSEDEKIKKAMKIRLCYIIPVINTWPQAINLGMRPENIYTTVTKISETIDLILSIKDDKYYDLNKSKLESNTPVSLVFGSAFNLLKYSLEGLLPYDLSKIEEIINIQSKVNKTEDDNVNEEKKKDEFRL